MPYYTLIDCMTGRSYSMIAQNLQAAVRELGSDLGRALALERQQRSARYMICEAEEPQTEGWLGACIPVFERFGEERPVSMSGQQ